LQGFGADNAKGDKLWDDAVKWTGKEYMLWFGTDNYSWTKNHAYGIIWAKELTINGKKTKVDPGSQPMGHTRLGWRQYVIGQGYVQQRLAGGEEILVVQVSPGLVRDALG